MISFNKKGFNLVEITLVAGILIILTCVVILIINPNEFKSKSRDTQRVKDLSTIYEALIEYKLKNGSYPGNSGQVYVSNSGFSSNLTNANNGWINSDISDFLQIQPIDPKNTGSYVYTYLTDGFDFELNCILEVKKDIMKNDKGNNANKFELGTNLDLIN